uniref:Uncharacterized protein n=1 Tax=Arundo donax TaxID=35708 RepID=A0A0A9DSG0_ARUDO
MNLQKHVLLKSVFTFLLETTKFMPVCFQAVFLFTILKSELHCHIKQILLISKIGSSSVFQSVGITVYDFQYQFMLTVFYLVGYIFLCRIVTQQHSLLCDIATYYFSDFLLFNALIKFINLDFESACMSKCY